MNTMHSSPDVDARHRTMTIIWLAQLLSVAGFFLLTLFVPRTEEPEGNDLLFFILLALGLSTVALSFVVRRQLLARATDQQQPALVPQAYIVAAALCEAAALFGLVIYFAAGTRYYYLLFLVGAVGMLLHKPSRDQLLAASYKRQF